MQFDSHRNKPTPGAVSECPSCKSKIVSKCGEIKIWHWAHESLETCDAKWEPITQWHLDWQSLVPEELTEVIIGKHIADIKLPTGKVIEIQHSNLPIDVVAERESFYENMVWIFDGREFEDRFIIKEKYDDNDELIYHTFKFKKPRQYIVHCTKFPVYIDFEEQIFEVKKFNSYKNWSEQYGKEYTSWTGWGHLRNKDLMFYKQLFGVSYMPKTKPTNGSESKKVCI